MKWMPGSALIIGALLFHWLPLMQRRNHFFGVTVPPGYRDSLPGRKLLRGYRTAIWLATALALGLLFLLQETRIALALAVQIAVALRAFAWVHLRVRKVGSSGDWAEAQSTSLRRSTSLDAEVPSFPLAWLATLIPILMLIGAALYLNSQWDRIPERFAVHWDFRGHANGWSTKSLKGVYGLVLIGLAMQGMLGFLAYGMLTGTRRARPGGSRMRMLKSNLWLMLMVQLLAGLLFAYLALLPLQTGGPPAGWIAAFAVCFTGVMIGYIVYMMKLQREPDDEPDNTPDSAWKWGGFLYYNREDPALMVEKRIGLGYTLNFGNSASWVFIGLVTLLTALPLYVFR